jgi:hypothetical protein
VKQCKELIKIVDELRHLDGVKGGIAIIESEYMATTVLQEAKPLTQFLSKNCYPPRRRRNIAVRPIFCANRHLICAEKIPEEYKPRLCLSTRTLSS